LSKDWFGRHFGVGKSNPGYAQTPRQPTA